MSVTVIGHNNHGKSSLLNALSEASLFSTSDQHETREWTQHRHNDICWYDTPGLQAEQHSQAQAEAALPTSDILLFVHALPTGELDDFECRQLRHWLAQRDAYLADHNRGVAQNRLVLTCADQLDEQESRTVMLDILAQVEGLPLGVDVVSAHRFEKGKQQQKTALMEHSGILELQQHLQQVKTHVDGARTKEADDLSQRILTAVNEQRRTLKTQRLQARQTRLQSQNDFVQRCHTVAQQLREEAAAIG